MPGEVVNRLRDRRLNVWEQAKGLAERAAEENRAFDGAEQDQWDQLNSELSALDRRIESMLAGEKREKEQAAEFERLTGGVKTAATAVHGTATAEVARQQNVTSEQLRAFFRGEAGRAIEIRPDRPILFGEEFRATEILKGTLTSGAYSGTGGPTVPISFYDRLVANLIEVATLLRGGATILNTAGGETIQIPKTTAHASGALIGENAAMVNAAPTFAQASLSAFKYGVIMQLSSELLADTGVDLEGYLAMQAGRAIGNALGTDLVVGDGSSKPNGIVKDATAGVTGGTGVGGAFTADNLIDLFYSVIAPYRASANCQWLLRDASVAVLRKLKTADGQYLFQPSLVAGTPDVLLGKPVYTDPNVPAVAVHSTGYTGYSVIFGDISQYYVRLAGGVRFERSDDFAFGNDLVTYRALLRGDGVLVDQTGAVKRFSGGAS